MLLQEGPISSWSLWRRPSESTPGTRRWAYPRLICARWTCFSTTSPGRPKPGQIKSFAGDGNNQWADQDATDAWAWASARRLAETIPTAEKFATIAQVVAGGGNSWTDLYQAYHRLLTWHEHTNAIDFIAPEPGTDAAL